MYYDDEARRFNFLSGLLFGAILGTGIGLLVNPSRLSNKPPHRIRDGASALRRGAEEFGRMAMDAGDRGVRAAAERMNR